MDGGVFAKHSNKALEWINQVDDLLQWENQAHALDALRAVLHQLRDNLPVIEAAHLGAQLPLIIRGIYYEEWQPSQVPVKERNEETFINSVRENLEKYIRRSFENEDIEEIIDAVFQTLSSRIDGGEIAKLGSIVPTGLKSLLSSAAKSSFES